jgi:hypothetical protein
MDRSLDGETRSASAPSRILATKVAALRYIVLLRGAEGYGKPSRAKLGVRPIAGKRLDNAALATNGRLP